MDDSDKEYLDTLIGKLGDSIGEETSRLSKAMGTVVETVGGIAGELAKTRADVVLLNLRVGDTRADVVLLNLRVGDTRAAVEALYQRVDQNHGEQLRAFQAVTKEAERIGAATATNARIAALESSLEVIHARLDKLDPPGKTEH